MKRLFITTDVEKAKGLYINTLDVRNKNLKSKIESDFTLLPMEYTMNNDFKIIVIRDDFKQWSDYKIQKENDFILYHSSSENSVIESVKSSFSINSHVQCGSHISGEYHDKIYRILFDDECNDKAEKIVEVLGFTDKQIEDKNILESQLNFLHHCLTPDGLKEEEVTKSEWAKLDEFTKLKSAGDGSFGDNYLSALRTLRDKLLVS